MHALLARIIRESGETGDADRIVQEWDDGAVGASGSGNSVVRNSPLPIDRNSVSRVDRCLEREHRGGGGLRDPSLIHPALFVCTPRSAAGLVRGDSSLPGRRIIPTNRSLCPAQQ
jgi:hypothetical protein